LKKGPPRPRRRRGPRRGGGRGPPAPARAPRGGGGGTPRGAPRGGTRDAFRQPRRADRGGHARRRRRGRSAPRPDGVCGREATTSNPPARPPPFPRPAPRRGSCRSGSRVSRDRRGGVMQAIDLGAPCAHTSLGKRAAQWALARVHTQKLMCHMWKLFPGRKALFVDDASGLSPHSFSESLLGLDGLDFVTWQELSQRDADHSVVPRHRGGQEKRCTSRNAHPLRHMTATTHE